MSLIYCPRLTAGFTWNFEIERERLALAPAILKQPAAAKPAEPFYGASVVVVHDDATLYLVAEMEDIDIFNAATEMNQRTWTLGDVLEIFLKPDSQESYYEFHVTPENRIMQLRIENMEAFYLNNRLGKERTREENLAAFAKNLVPERIIESRTEIRSDLNRWRVMASVPLDRISENKKWERDDTWLVSFCRYDYTRGNERPVVSSSSSHERADFHDQRAWRRLVFNSGESLS